MKINIQAKNMDLTPAIREYAEKKISTLSKFIDAEDDEIQMNIEVGKTTNHHRSGDIFRAEVLVSFPSNDKGLYAESEKDYLYSAIDDVRDEMERELIKLKGRRRSLLKKGAILFKKLLSFLPPKQ